MLFISSLRIKHKDYFLEGEGSINLLEGNADMRARLVLQEEISRELVGAVPELKVMLNSKERVVVDFVYRGLMPDATIFPDLTSVRVLMNEAARRRSVLDVAQTDLTIAPEVAAP